MLGRYWTLAAETITQYMYMNNYIDAKLFDNEKNKNVPWYNSECTALFK